MDLMQQSLDQDSYINDKTMNKRNMGDDHVKFF